ncbi:carboxypeptidase regulatory-like domain-containing protein [Terriglobus sp. 2YAB30_2]|uniref:TonB-dependent receptor n=1 Tax=Terriglobus sp. 2YAB30_2 TaxID=3233023 RepID=UPI003F9C1CA9
MKLIRLALLLAIFCIPSFGQMTTARLVGTVTDQSGAVIPNATVVVKNIRTGESRTVTTNDSGLYIIPSLVPSEYEVKVTASGFSDAESKGVVLAVGQELVKDISLPVAGSATSVLVDAGQLVALDTSSARIGANIASREIEDLPINGRQVSQLYLLAPGATNVGSGNFGEIRFSGRAVEQNILRLDGVEATAIIDAAPGNLNGEANSIFRLQQSLEAIQEFRVDSNSYPAEMGTGTGGQISFVTKSGSNAFHGSVFEYLRNDFFDARNTFNAVNVANNSPKFRLNQFGGSVGGPLIKDKLFFFGVYEGLRQYWNVASTGNTISNYTISRIPTNSPIRNVVGAYPLDRNPIAIEQPGATFTDGTVNGATGRELVSVSRAVPFSLTESFAAVRFDYHFNEKYSSYVRFNRDQGTANQTQDPALGLTQNKYVPQNGVIALNQVLSASMFNETKVGFNYAKTRVNGVSGPSPNADLSASLFSIANAVKPGGLVTTSSSFTGRGAPYTAWSISPIDNFSIVKGNHNLKFGFESRIIKIYNDQLGGTQYTFNSVSNFVNNVPDTTAFNGDLSAPSPFSGISGNAQMRQNYYIGYGQDEWKLRPTLTLAYGLRYEYFQPLHEVNDKYVFFDMTTATLYSSGRVAAFPKYNKSWFGSSTKNFGPRLGLTWAPAGLHNNTVVRVGAGIFFGPGQTEDQVQPEANDRVGRSFSNGAQPYPANTANLLSSFDANNLSGFQPRAYAPYYHLPERVATYTFSIQQQLPGQMQMMIGYVGSQGRNLFLRSITNRITSVTTNASTGAGTAVREFGSRYGEIDYKTSGGTNHYHSLQSTLQRRFRQGLSLGAQYTWAKELGTTSGSNEASTAQNPYDFNTEYGRGNFDIRHSMNATVLYDLPIGHGKSMDFGSIGNAVVGGWQIGGIVNFRSGLPVDVLITRPDIAYVGTPTSGTYAGKVYSSPVLSSSCPAYSSGTTSVNAGVCTTAVVNVPGGGNTRNIRRVNLVPGVNPYTNVGKQLLNPAAFTIPTPGTFGSLRRNSLNGASLAQLDMTLEKTFAITERVKVDFKAEGFNILNHPNYAVPGTIRLAQGIPTGGNAATTTISNGVQPGQAYSTGTAGSNFGTFTSTVGNQVGQGANRQLQLSGRINF